ncbi:MAG: hypothetical protein ACR2M1_05100 [Gemmatimonadaceae bacterium]
MTGGGRAVQTSTKRIGVERERGNGFADVFGDLAKASTSGHQLASTAPEDRGQRLGTFPRGDSKELRVSLAEFKGHKYVSLRVCTQNARGEWWPQKNKRCSVRLGELDGFADAIGYALDLVSEGVASGGDNANA